MLMPNLAGIDFLRNQNIESLLETRPLFSEDDRVAKAIGFLRATNSHEIFASREKRIVGVTTRDLLSVSDPLGTKLGSLLYGLPEVTTKSMMSEAARLMFDYRLWALPAARNGGSLQVVTSESIMKAMADCLDFTCMASTLMNPGPGTVEADETVLKARSLMVRRNLDHLVVLNEGRVDGVLTSSDILFDLLPEEKSPTRGNAEVRFDYPVSKLARQPEVEVKPSEAAREVVAAMLKQRSSYAIVKLWDELQGVITYREAMRPLLETRSKETPFYIVGTPGEPFEAEAAKMKLEHLGRSLTKAIPSIREIRAVVKSRESRSGRRRYEVSFDIYAPALLHAYVEEGYDLSEIFDKVGPRLKRILSEKQSKVTRTGGETPRKRFRV